MPVCDLELTFLVGREQAMTKEDSQDTSDRAARVSVAVFPARRGVGDGCSGHRGRRRRNSSPAAELLPTISLGKHRVTRLITGWNPIGGFSHQTLNASLHMLEYFTPERTFEFIAKCEAAGINTWQVDHTEKSVAVVRKLREKGSKMQIICLHAESGHVPAEDGSRGLGADRFRASWQGGLQPLPGRQEPGRPRLR